MTKRQYLELAMRQPIAWLKASAANPGPYMRPRHVLLQRLAARKLERAGRA